MTAPVPGRNLHKETIVIVSASTYGFGGYAEPGDRIILELGGQKREFQVLGVGGCAL